MLAEELIHRTDDIVDRWLERWRRIPRDHPDLSDAALKNDLPQQLRVIGAQLRDLGRAESPAELWTKPDRLDPERRVEQDFPIEEVVKEYRIAIETLREWVEERNIAVSFQEWSYVTAAIFELVAESVRRYATHEADAVRESRAQYLAAVMHQLRTPLAALLVQVELLDRTDQRPDANAVARLRRNVRRIRMLVDGILRLERYEPSEIPVHPRPVHAVALVDSLMSDFEHEAAQKGLRFEARIDRTLHMTIDPDLFTDALGNLVHNGIKYTERGFVIIEAEQRDDEVVFHVRDSGSGMTADRRRTLFREAQPGGAGGVGIGLQIAQHAAAAQNGHIEVDSEPGRGSTFSLHMPKQAPPLRRNGRT